MSEHGTNNRYVSGCHCDECRKAHAEYARAQRKRVGSYSLADRRRRDWITSQGGVCAVCGGTDRLEVDHIDRATKEYQPYDIWHRRKEVREAELAKCQVLCYGCHKTKTITEIPQWRSK